ncbi:MAG: ATP phosphoribosyltransferase regulatory subunit [Maritimibacter harenae]|jgi:ATP phosphoribosyltransferase regulatory subunit|uniref:ATP phosphoribosyltransferase regulatory subunit n=1 Tax=Maritimibacter harenae TaxID=2606218 RepID=A0A845M085_9RHOB|nr:ATP phosphoribosyltransferase regulatory subunit [Maritimibacter harenae]MZR12542.1 ATP phosphoribosyltransferase regulatory subunit [Maritimibacter harenae]
MTETAAIRAEAARLLALFEGQGAQVAETSVLQPAETLLDLYGEDIRARAYVTTDPHMGEAMLRPDFTVPVVQMHMADGAEPARYTYAGEVFRKQEDDARRAPEYMQVGYEVFDRSDPAASDAEVFAVFSDILGGAGLRAATGDLGILLAAVRGLTTTERRKAALLRHLWRPRRFRALLDRFSGRAPQPEGRAALATGDPLADLDAPIIGLRGRAEIEERIEALREDMAAPPIPEPEVALLNDLMSLRETVSNVCEHLRDLAVDLPAIGDAVDRFCARASALAAHGVDIDALDFEGSFGRTTLEYYDGFVFGFYAAARPDLPPVATGGRYDALTRVLGRGSEIPAVGGVIRPELLLAAGGKA